LILAALKIGIASDFAYIEVKGAKTSETVAGTWRATNKEVKLKSPAGSMHCSMLSSKQVDARSIRRQATVASIFPSTFQML
jgi:hypothetical protein